MVCKCGIYHIVQKKTVWIRQLVSAQIIAYLTNLLVAISAEEDECSAGKHNCDSNADCVDTTTGFECHCRSSYEGNGTHCISKTMYAVL